MGSHSWFGECPVCGYEAMDCGVDHGNDWEQCPVCGRRRYMVEEHPTEEELELAKRLLATVPAAQWPTVLEEMNDAGEAVLVKCDDKVRELLGGGGG